MGIEEKEMKNCCLAELCICYSVSVSIRDVPAPYPYPYPRISEGEKIIFVRVFYIIKFHYVYLDMQL